MSTLHIPVLDNDCRCCVREVIKAIFFRYIEPGTCLLRVLSHDDENDEKLMTHFMCDASGLLLQN